ncbi:MAG TPA: hypothetical protein VFE98_09905 [Candidatus Bathyarchaeia archaeon]|nr:hypothetical protein [Candidatus Bathyarchaeia archaeon]
MTDFSDPSLYLPATLGVVAVMLACYALWRQKQDRGVAKATFNLLRTMRKELRTAPTPPTGITPTPQQSIVSQAELRKRDALEWKKLKDVAKALGWVWDRMNEDD